jgi:hypothetical protein
MQTFTARCAVITMLVALGGCGSSTSSGGTPVALTDFASESAKATCALIYKCCDATERAADTTFGTTEAECVTMQTPTLATGVASFQAGIDAGKITFHGDRARKCLDNIKGLSCDWGIAFNRRYVPDCAHVFDGTVANGTACAMDEECMSGFCSPTGCAARGKAGDACGAPTGCEDGLYCPVSAGDHCVAVAAIGQACQVSVACENASCVVPDGQTAGTCGAPMMCNGQ